MTISPSRTQRRAMPPQWLDSSGKVTVEWLFIPALDEDLIAVAKHQRAKSIPLGLKNPIFPWGQFIDTLGQHGQERGIHGKIHFLMV